jgi:ionotropic glutamate receptor
MSMGLTALLRREDPLAKTLFHFMDPFSMHLWLGIAGAYFVMSFTLYFLEYLQRLQLKKKQLPRQTQVFTLQESLWFSITTLLQQEAEVFPARTALRVLATGWWFFCLIIISTYTANLAAFLTVKQMQAQWAEV